MADKQHPGSIAAGREISKKKFHVPVKLRLSLSPLSGAELSLTGCAYEKIDSLTWSPWRPKNVEPLNESVPLKLCWVPAAGR